MRPSPTRLRTIHVGTTSRSPVIIEDVFPTILELAGADWRGKTIQTGDGVSLVPLLKADPATATDVNDISFPCRRTEYLRLLPEHGMGWIKDLPGTCDAGIVVRSC